MSWQDSNAQSQQESARTPQALDRVVTGISYQNDILEKNRRIIKRDKKRHQKIRRRKGIVQHKKRRISSVDIVWACCKNGR
jgi:uncharacterized protein (DUF2384 family)